VDASWVDAAAAAAQKRDHEFIASRFAEHASRLEREQGAAARAEILRGVLRVLLVRGRPRIPALRLPVTVKTLLEHEYRRIETDLTTQGDEHYDLANHSMRCDFRIVGFNRIPVGVHHVEMGGVPRRLLWSGGVTQAFRAAAVLTRAGGWAPFYVSHFAHGIERRAFRITYTREAQAVWHRNVAECLRLNPHVRGLLATSWWYDPQLADVAPHLAFLRDGSLAHGAIQLRAGHTEGATRMALANSPMRQQLHAAGKYTPTSYALIWTRQALLAWAG
jgi:hypothetical protein